MLIQIFQDTPHKVRRSAVILSIFAISFWRLNFELDFEKFPMEGVFYSFDPLTVSTRWFGFILLIPLGILTWRFYLVKEFVHSSYNTIAADLKEQLEASERYGKAQESLERKIQIYLEHSEQLQTLLSGFQKSHEEAGKYLEDGFDVGVVKLAILENRRSRGLADAAEKLVSDSKSSVEAYIPLVENQRFKEMIMGSDREVNWKIQGHRGKVEEALEELSRSLENIKQWKKDDIKDNQWVHALGDAAGMPRKGNNPVIPNFRALMIYSEKHSDLTNSLKRLSDLPNSANLINLRSRVDTLIKSETRIGLDQRIANWVAILACVLGLSCCAMMIFDFSYLDVCRTISSLCLPIENSAAP